MQNMVVETDALDDIRPDYEATLEICSKDEPFSVSVACIGKPCALNFFYRNMYSFVWNWETGNVLIYNIT